VARGVTRGGQALDVERPYFECISIQHFLGECADSVVASVNLQLLGSLFDQILIASGMVPKNGIPVIKQKNRHFV